MVLEGKPLHVFVQVWISVLLVVSVIPLVA
jgi:hypothetical protein